ncbi:MAG: phosphoribosylformylglycinamidine synthase subunit PurL [Candidatus Muiribacteriota bacterium]
MKTDYKKMGLTEKEWNKINSFLKREPNLTETGIISVMWSEHCSYKNSKKHLKKFPVEGENILQGPGENAGIVDIGDELAVTFKIESHNHPSAVEPYQGAATGVGGILRDIFTMGARPFSILNSLRFGSLQLPENRHIFEGVVSGIAGYGNCMGVPTVGGEIYFNKCYNTNPLVNVMAAGLIKHNQIKRSAASGVGYPVFIVGSKTGRDGIHGATFASDELSDNSIEDRASVQVGDPFMEKLLMEACLELFKYDYITGIQDMGAAGLTCSTFEMAHKAKGGMEINLNYVPQREENMTPYEIMLSESQERMLMVVKPGFEEKVKQIFNKWDVNIAEIGKVIENNEVIIKNGKKIVASLPVDFVVEGFPVYHREEKKPSYMGSINLQKNEIEELPCRNIQTSLKILLNSPDLKSREEVYSQYDYQVGANTLKKPGEADSACIRIRGTNKAVGMTTDCNSIYCYIDPYMGAKMAVYESARNLAASGLKPLAVTNCLNFGNPLEPEVYYQFAKCTDGIADACRELNTPVTGGNVSFYNQNQKKAVHPTPVIGMVGMTEDFNSLKSNSIKKDMIVGLIGKNYCNIGGSQYLKNIFNMEKGPLIPVDVEEEKKLILFILENISLFGGIHDVSEGGIACCLYESLKKGETGAKLQFEYDFRKDFYLFSESPGRYIFGAYARDFANLEKKADEFDVELKKLGIAVGKNLIINDEINLEIL